MQAGEYKSILSKYQQTKNSYSSNNFGNEAFSGIINVNSKQETMLKVCCRCHKIIGNLTWHTSHHLTEVALSVIFWQMPLVSICSAPGTMLDSLHAICQFSFRPNLMVGLVIPIQYRTREEKYVQNISQLGLQLYLLLMIFTVFVSF